MRLIDADALLAEITEENPMVHFGPFGYCGCSPNSDFGEKVFMRERVLEIVESAPTMEAVVLPCKPGTTVHEVSNNTDACYDCRYYTGFCGDEYCDRPKHETEFPTIQDFPVCEKQFLEVISYAATERQLFDSRKKFGKMIFLTNAEAEAALAEMKGMEVGT